VIGVETLADAVAHLRGERTRSPTSVDAAALLAGAPASAGDLADVRGQPLAKRALEVAAAGAHNILFLGAPGSGKTMLARRLPSILPPLALAEAIEVTSIHSVAGLLGDRALVTSRPGGAPTHHLRRRAPRWRPSHPPSSSPARGVPSSTSCPVRRNALEPLRQPLEGDA
jgi:magnesium chelatase family protein